jgi:drug/metabolite transporter (DMT)-like permease
MTKYQKLIVPARAGIIYAFEPIFSAIVAFFVLREKISNFGFIGGALIFSGLLVSELLDKKSVKLQ